MKRLLVCAFLVGLGACQQGHGERCNPLRATNDCEDPGSTCIYPVTPGCNPSQPGSNCCGVPYCCKVDSSGNITDTDPHCQVQTQDTDVLNACVDGGTD